MEQDKFKYKIGDKAYIQKPLVLGQVNQLMATIKGVVLPKSMDLPVLLAAFGNKLPVVLAIVLHEEKPLMPVPDDGFVYLRDRDLTAIADDIEFTIDPETALQVAEDFFDCNPMLSLLERFAKLGENLNSKINQAKLGSIKSPSSSPEETSQKETVSFGNIAS